MTAAVNLAAIANGPAFAAYATTGVAFSAGTSNKINFQAEDFDTNNNYDTSTSRFTPTVPGYYLIIAGCGMSGNTERVAYIGKNGSTWVQGNDYTAGYIGTVSGILYLNGTTDYVEIYFYSGSAGTTYTGRAQSYFQGCLIRGV